MFHLLRILVLVFLAMPDASNAGVACYGACLQSCLAVGAYAFANPLGIAVGVTGCNTVCMVACACALFVPPACFANDTTIAVPNPDGLGVHQQLISAIRPGDDVLTLVDGRPATTRVMHNIHSTGSFEFFEFWLQKDQWDGLVTSTIKVTPEHGMLLAVDHYNSGPAQTRFMFPADVKTGDRMHTADGLKATVMHIERSVRKDRFTLVTAEGSVLASQVLVSTVCENEVNTDRAMEDVLYGWKRRHQYEYSLEICSTPVCLAK